MNFTARSKQIFLAILLVLASANIVRTAYEILKSSKRLDDLGTEISALETTKNNLAKELEYKKTDDYVEERAREDLNMVKPGEKLVVLVNSKGEATEMYQPGEVLPASTYKPADQNKESNVRLWYRLFFDK